MTNDPTTPHDVLIIGGGPAGLSGAMTLARARRSVLVVDSGAPRNAPAHGVHGYLGREGIAPAELAALGREELASYGGEVVVGEVAAAERDPDGLFHVTLTNGDVHRARRLLLATGLVDQLPELPGLASRWGREVVHCPYCHGWEARDRAIGILGLGLLQIEGLAAHQALLWRQWSADITLFSHDLEISEDDRRKLTARGVRLVEGRISELVVEDDRLTGVALEDGRTVPVEYVVAGARLDPRPELLGLLESLAVELADFDMHGVVVARHVKVDAMGKTSADGVWAAGNLVDPTAQVIISAGMGLRAGAAMNMDLVNADIAAALEPSDGHGHGHQHSHGHTNNPPTEGPDPVTNPSGFWDARYGEKDRIWSGRPNQALVAEASDLHPGRALDLGAGEGADAIWLAERGWQVTAVDVSQVALDRGAVEAEHAGVAALIEWQRHDLTKTFPAGEYDLVTAQYLHAPAPAFPRREILARAAAAVAPGGVLLVVGHATFPAWLENPPNLVLPLATEVLAELALPDDAWEVLRAEEFERDAPGPDGQPGTRADNTVMLRRRVEQAASRV